MTSTNNSKTFYSGSKLHLLTHLPVYKFRFGAFKKTTDTELSDHSHLKYVKKVYEHTNKKKSEVEHQMLLSIKKYGTLPKFSPLRFELSG